KTAEYLDMQGVVKREDVVTNCDYIGDGYGIPTGGTIEAVTMLARTEAILLDPVYTGKGMAGLIDLVRKGYFREKENLVFIHTGGAQALPGYRKALVPDVSSQYGTIAHPPG